MGDDDDESRSFMPLLRRIMIVLVVLAATPVILWTITAFVRAYVAPPKVPTFRPLAAAASMEAPQSVAGGTDITTGSAGSTDHAKAAGPVPARVEPNAVANDADTASSAPRGPLLGDHSPVGAGDAPASMAKISEPKLHSPKETGPMPMMAAASLPAASRTAGAIVISARAAPKDSAIPGAMAGTAPRTAGIPVATAEMEPKVAIVPAATADAEPRVADIPTTSSKKLAKTADLVTTEGTPQATPSVTGTLAAQPPPTSNEPSQSADNLPAAAPLNGPIPLPRARPRTVAMAQTTVPLPRPRPEAADPATTKPAPLEWLQKLFQPHQ